MSYPGGIYIVKGYGTSEFDGVTYRLHWLAEVTLQQLHGYLQGHGCTAIELSDWRYENGQPIAGSPLSLQLQSDKQRVTDLDEVFVLDGSRGKISARDFLLTFDNE